MQCMRVREYLSDKENHEESERQTNKLDESTKHAQPHAERQETILREGGHLLAHVDAEKHYINPHRGHIGRAGLQVGEMDEDKGCRDKRHDADDEGELQVEDDSGDGAVADTRIVNCCRVVVKNTKNTIAVA